MEPEPEHNLTVSCDIFGSSQDHYFFKKWDSLWKASKMNFHQNLSLLAKGTPLKSFHWTSITICPSQDKLNIIPFQEHYLLTKGTPLKSFHWTSITICPSQDKLNIIPFQEHYLLIKGTPLKSFHWTSITIYPSQDKLNIVPFQEHYLLTKGTPLKSFHWTSITTCPCILTNHCTMYLTTKIKLLQHYDPRSSF